LIHQLGLSNVDSAHLAEARGIAPVAAVQNAFNIEQRAEARDVVRADALDLVRAAEVLIVSVVLRCGVSARLCDLEWFEASFTRARQMICLEHVALASTDEQR
jgi:hypothetical protein